MKQPELEPYITLQKKAALPDNLPFKFSSSLKHICSEEDVHMILILYVIMESAFNLPTPQDSEYLQKNYSPKFISITRRDFPKNTLPERFENIEINHLNNKLDEEGKGSLSQTSLCVHYAYSLILRGKYRDSPQNPKTRSPKNNRKKCPIPFFQKK